MIAEEIVQCQTRIEEIKKRLVSLGEMRPGSLSKQFNVCGNPTCRCKDPKNPKKHGPYYQVSYTHKGKSSTQFVKRDNVTETKTQLENYRTFKKLIDEWVDLSVKIARLRKKEEGRKSK
jgi:hypothetical protein